MVPGEGRASARCPGSKAHFQCDLLEAQAGQEAGQLQGSLCPGPLCPSFPVWSWRPASGPLEGRPSLPWPPGHYLVRLYPCCSEEKSRRGWQSANRSGIHDQMSLISFTLTISEWKFSAWTARCTNCLGRAGRGSEHSCNPSPDHTARPGGVQRLSWELGLEGTSHLFSQVRAWAYVPSGRNGGAVPWSPAPISLLRGENAQPRWGQKHLFSKKWGQKVSQLWQDNGSGPAKHQQRAQLRQPSRQTDRRTDKWSRNVS